MLAFNPVSENPPEGDCQAPRPGRSSGIEWDDQAAGSGVLLEKHSASLRAKNWGPDRTGFNPGPTTY